jgi:hypothetical protein
VTSVVGRYKAEDICSRRVFRLFDPIRTSGKSLLAGRPARTAVAAKRGHAKAFCEQPERNRSVPLRRYNPKTYRRCGGGSRTPRQFPRVSAQTDRGNIAAHAINPGPFSNRLLAGLPRRDFELLSARLMCQQPGVPGLAQFGPVKAAPTSLKYASRAAVSGSGMAGRTLSALRNCELPGGPGAYLGSRGRWVNVMVPDAMLPCAIGRGLLSGTGRWTVMGAAVIG